MPVLCQEFIVDFKEVLNLFEGFSDQALDVTSVCFVKLVVKQPLVTVEVNLIGWLPLFTNAVVPVFKNSLIFVQVWMPTPSLKYFEAFHALLEALVDFSRESLTIGFGFKPDSAQVINELCWVSEDI